jgi:hypothetical protein
VISRVALAVLIAGYSILPGIHAQPVGSEDKASPKAGSVPALTDSLGDPLPPGAIARRMVPWRPRRRAGRWRGGKSDHFRRWSERR